MGIDFSQLNDQQISVAKKIVAEAERQDVDPDYALALAFTENQFNNGKSPKGAIGPMQLMPKTAKFLKVDPYNEDQNIRGGITYLKQGLQKFDGDKVKAAIGYNAGPDHSFFKSDNTSEIPDETLGYISKINALYPLDVKKQEEPKPTNKAIDGSDLEPVQDTGENTGKVLDTSNARDIPGMQEAEKTGLGVAGAVGGAGVTTGIETGKKVLPLVPNILRGLVGKDINVNSPSTRTSMQRYLQSQIAGNLHLNLNDLEKEYNALMQAKNPGAKPAKIRTMAEVQRALDAMKPTEDQMIRKPRIEQVEGRPGLFRETGEFTTHKVPGNPGIDMTKYEINPSQPFRNVARSTGSQVKTAGNVIKEAMPSVGRIGLGALGGLGALTSGYDTYEYAKEHGLTPRTISKAAATLGGGLMMFPTPLSEVTGMLLSAPELALTGYDYLNRPKEENSVKE